MSEEKQESTAQQPKAGTPQAAQHTAADSDGKAGGTQQKTDAKPGADGQDRKKTGGTSSSRRRRKRNKSARKGRTGNSAQEKGGQQHKQQPAKAPDNPAEEKAPVPAEEKTSPAEKQPAAPEEKTQVSPAAEERKEPDAKPAHPHEDKQPDKAGNEEEPAKPRPEPETPPAWPVDADAQSEEEAHVPDEAEQARLAEITRTVQVSVEQILAGAEQAAAQNEYADDESEEEFDEPRTAADRAGDMGRSLARWLVLVLGAILLIAVVGVGWLYVNASDESIPELTVTFDGQTVETASYSWHVPVVGNSFKRTYAKTLHRDPVELTETVDTSAPRLTVSPSGYQTEVTITDAEEEEIFTGTLNEYRKFEFPANGTYTIELVVSTETGSDRNAAVSGKQTYLFTFEIGIRPTIRLNTRTVAQGGVASIRVSNLQTDQAPTLSGTLQGTDFFALGDAWWAFVPIPSDQAQGGYTLMVQADGYTEELELSVTAGKFGYSDVSSKSRRVTPYLGPEDTPAEVQALLTTADPQLYWADSGFALPFQRSVEVKLAYGAPEYVGRTRNERTANIDNGTGRHADNVVVTTRWGDTLVSPADGRVLLAGDLGDTAGNTVVIEHGAGVKTIFYGLGSVGVKAGDKVKQGDDIGTTVSSTIVEVRIGDVAVEPLSVLRGECGALQVG